MRDKKGLLKILSIIFPLLILGCRPVHHESVSSEEKELFYPDSKPYTRWWWFSGPIKREDVAYQLDWVKENGFGGVEIAWVYPLDPESTEKRMEFLGKEWADIVAYTKSYAVDIGIGCDFTFGTLWPFGGSFVENRDAVKKFGESECRQHQEKSWEYPVMGNVLNHMDRNALDRYAQVMLTGLDKAMKIGRSGWFCDSWEVDTRYMWTDGFDKTFFNHFGYDIKPFMPRLYSPENADVFYDYMKLVSKYVLDEFYRPFTEISHLHGGFSRVQCGGAPADLLDAFAAVDVPESEAILFEPRFSRIPASAAVLAGKSEISAEAFTCLYGWKGWPGPGPYAKKEQTADLKILADSLFAHGVNQIFWHGMPFNGRDGKNMFYATVHVGPDSHFVKDLPAFNGYMQKVSALMKEGQTYSDAAVYLPLEDSWMQGEYPEELQMPWVWGAYELRYIEPAQEVKGYFPLWINSRFLEKGVLEGGRLRCGDASFSFLYVDVDYLDSEALDIIIGLAEQGFPVCLKKNPREPGLMKSKDYKSKLEKLCSLDCVHSDLHSVIRHKPLIESSGSLDFWAREWDKQCRIFFPHPSSRGLKYPLRYGQSACEGPIEENIIINWNGTAFDVRLKFNPYQSLMLKIDGKGTLGFEDISFVPDMPVGLRR